MDTSAMAGVVRMQLCCFRWGGKWRLGWVTENGGCLGKIPHRRLSPASLHLWGRKSPCTASLCPPNSQVRGFSHFSLQISKLSSLKHPARQARVWVSAVLGLTAEHTGATKEAKKSPEG